MAFANVRTRARATRLLGPTTTARLRARDPATRAAALRELGANGEASDTRELTRARLARLVEDYEVLARSYPRGSALLVALARLHEIENLKLLLRGAHGEPAADRISALWRPLGKLATLRLADALEVRSLSDVATLAARTPYADLVGAAASADGAPGAARVELPLDRFGSLRLLAEARAVERAEPVAASLVLDLVRERDLETLVRAPAYGVAPELAPSLAVLLPDEPDAKRLSDLAAWTPDRGPLASVLPRSLAMSGSPHVDSLSALVRALRRRRRHACAAAFIGSPFRLAPAVAYLLLAEAEIRGLTALAEAAGETHADPIVDLALAGSALGD
jgi:vacuolar-type H+-ATPase subunit C/Vma6